MNNCSDSTGENEISPVLDCVRDTPESSGVLLCLTSKAQRQRRHQTENSRTQWLFLKFRKLSRVSRYFFSFFWKSLQLFPIEIGSPCEETRRVTLGWKVDDGLRVRSWVRVPPSGAPWGSAYRGCGSRQEWQEFLWEDTKADSQRVTWKRSRP